MKRRIVLSGLLAALLIMALTACGSGENSGPNLGNIFESGNPGSEGAGNASSGGEEESGGGSSLEDSGLALPDTGNTVHIKTPEDMLAFAQRVNEGEKTLNAVLDADIDMSGVCGPSNGNWTAVKELEGVFDGNGHVISNLYCVQNESATVFNTLRGTVKNLELKDVVIESAEKNAAGLVISLSGTIENCRVSGSVKGYDKAGGIVTDIYRDSLVADCVNEATVESGYYNESKFAYGGRTAGIAAWPRTGGEIRNCVNKGEIIGKGSNAGGIIGSSEEGYIFVEDCMNEGSVCGPKQAGGIAGYAGENTLINRCINRGKVSGTSMVAGIVVGSDHAVLNCANQGDLEATGEGEVYGIARIAIKGLVNCYNTGNLSSQNRAVGIGYSSRAMMMNVYNYGTITCTVNKGYLTDIGPWSTGAEEGLMNTWAKEGCFVVPDDFDMKNYSGIQATNATASGAFTDGTILDALNDGVEKFNSGNADNFEENVRAFISRFMEEGDFEFSKWIAGSDGLPRFEWEQ